MINGNSFRLYSKDNHSSSTSEEIIGLLNVCYRFKKKQTIYEP